MAKNNNNGKWRQYYHCFLWLLPGLATFILPLVVLFFIIEPTLVSLMPAEWFNTRTLLLFDAAGKQFELFARDIDGRMSFSVLSAAVLAASGGAILYAFFVVSRRFSSGAALLIVGVAMLIGVAICNYGGGGDIIECKNAVESPTRPVEIGVTLGFRTLVLDDIVCIAERDKITAPGGLTKMRSMILLNSRVGFAAAAAVMAAFGAIAIGGGKLPVITRLRRRLDAFKILTIVGSMLFVINALITKSLVTWVQNLLDPVNAINYGKLSGALLNYWAAQTSAILFVTVICAAIGIRRQVDSAADTAVAEMPVQQQVSATKWKETNGLTFETSTVLTATIGTVAPLLAGPAVDLVSNVMKTIQ